MKVAVQAPTPYESSVDNPLGDGRAPHRIWTWADGSWLLVRFVDDGPIIVTSAELMASLEDRGDALVVRVERAAPDSISL